MAAERFDLLVVTEKEGQKAFFTKVGVMFPAKSGDGFSIFLDALPVNGKLIARRPLPKDGERSADDLDRVANPPGGGRGNDEVPF